MKYLESINISLKEILTEEEKAIVIGEDVVDPYGGAFKVTKGLSTIFPKRVISTPISESGIVGMAIGMAMKGYKPIVEIMFGDFVTLIADQIINSATKFSLMYNGKVDVPIVIRTPMGGRRGYGPTHSQTIETIFFNIPNLKIVAPSLYHSPGNLLKQIASKEKQPVIFIENKTLYSEKLIENSDFFNIHDFFDKHNYPIKNIEIKNEIKNEVTIITYGGMLSIVLDAIKEVFINEEIVTNVVAPSLIKPIDIDTIIIEDCLSSKILIVEESVVYGGWGSELLSQIHEINNQSRTIVNRIGAKEFVIPCSMPLEKMILPQKEDIYNAIIKLYEKDNN